MQSPVGPSLSSFRSIQIFPSAIVRPPSTLMWRDELPAEIVERHDVGGGVRAFNVYEVTGAEYGGLATLTIGGRPFAPVECYPDYLERMLLETARDHPDHVWCGALFASRPRKIKCKHPILAPFHPNLIYGHFLIEMLPRLLAADRWETTGAPLALSTESPSWLKKIVAVAVPSRKILWFNSKEEVLVAPAVLVPASMQGDHHHFHPAMRTSIAEFKARLGVGSRPATKRLYLSRSRLPEKETRHRLRDELAIERMFAEYEFEIVHPQDLSFEQQVALYDQAAVIAGEFSSALHNAVFARPGCRIFSINWINWLQSRISTLMEQPIAYVPTIKGFLDWQYLARDVNRLEVDLDLLRRKLEEFVSAA